MLVGKNFQADSPYDFYIVLDQASAKWVRILVLSGACDQRCGHASGTGVPQTEPLPHTALRTLLDGILSTGGSPKNGSVVLNRHWDDYS